MYSRILRYATGVIAFFISGAAFCQSDSLALSSGVTTAGGTVSLNLSLTSPSGSEAGMEWTFTYSSSAITNISALAGAAAKSASKSLACAGSSGYYTCFLTGLTSGGLNANVIGNGVVAVLTVTLAAGTSSTNIGITNALGSSASGGAIQVVGTGGTVSTSVPLSLTSLSCNPGTLTSGASASCTVTVNQAASANTFVTLSNNNTLLTVPAAVTVSSGTSSATFIATAGTLPSNQTATITASLNGTLQATTITLIDPAVVSSLGCNPASVNSSSSTTCTVTLNQAAPSGGSTVALSSNNTALPVGASVTVPVGSESATFSATVGTITTNQTAAITASLNGSSQSTTLSLIAPTLVSSLACNPTSINSGASTTCTVSLSQAAPSGGSTVTLSSNNTALPVGASVTVPASSKSATFSATVGTITTNQSATITATLNGSSQTASLSLVAQMLVSGVVCSPTSISANASSTCTVTLSQAAPPAGINATVTDNSSQLTVPASVAVAAGSTSGTFTATTGNITSGQTVTVTASLNGASRTASITLAVPIQVSALTCNAATISPTTDTTCTVTLSQVAESGGGVVTLSANNTAVGIPATLTVPAGATSASFTATVSSLFADATVTLTATLSGSSQTASLALVPIASVTSVSCNPTALLPAGAGTCTVVLNRGVYQARRVQLSASSGLLRIPPSVTVAAGANSTTFTATAGSFNTNQSVTVTASLNTQGWDSSATFTLSLSPVLLSTLACNPTSLNAGSSSTCTVGLSSAAPAGGVTLALTGETPTLTVPSVVTIPAAASTATFSVTAAAATAVPGGQSNVTITATLNGGSQSVPFIVTICPCSLFSATAQPTNPDSGASQATTVGLRFTSAMSGYVTGLRFYKAPSNTGAHVGNLWSTKGSLLATVTFTNETSSGWQLAYFPSPVAVAANTPYIISYSAPNGHYAADNGVFTNGLSNLPLSALADGANGPNGVYQSGSGGFPAAGASATNFWVDAVFNTSAVVGTAAPVSLWSAGAAPKTPAAPTSQAAQLGTTFISSAGGYATGLRYYRSSTNVGPHQGYLWSSTGTLLASVTFTNESASGWQQANFATPVAISDYIPYIVSYWAPQGQYAADTGYFATAGLTNQMLYAPPDGQYGPNGVSAANQAFPASSSSASNFWVDVVFSVAIQ